MISERKIDANGVVLKTIWFNIENYIKQTCTGSSFYNVRTTDQRVIYHKENKKWEEIYNWFRISLRLITADPEPVTQERTETQGVPNKIKISLLKKVI